MPMQRHTQNNKISQPLSLRNLSPSHANKPPMTISPHPKRRRSIGESSGKDEAGGFGLGRSSAASDGSISREPDGMVCKTALTIFSACEPDRCSPVRAKDSAPLNVCTLCHTRGS
jgi:hypothetical protein